MKILSNPRAAVSCDCVDPGSKCVPGIMAFVCLLLSIFISSGSFLAAADFRVDNELRVGSRKEAIKSTTYFVGKGDFFSQIGENGEMTFFEAEKAVFTLLDPRLRLQTHLAADEMKKKVELWRQKNRESQTPLVAFVAKPAFQKEFSSESGMLALQSPWFQYRLNTEPFFDQETGNRYLDFCDWSCLLNFRIDGHTSPVPLARLEVNRVLRESKLFPKSISVSYFPKGNQGLFPREEKAESTHRIVMRLDEADNRKIEKAREFMRNFISVPFAEYQKKAGEIPYSK